MVLCLFWFVSFCLNRPVGLSPDLQSMEQIRRIMRPTDVPDQGWLYGCGQTMLGCGFINHGGVKGEGLVHLTRYM